MPYKLEFEKLEKKSKEKIESEIRYLSEENAELRRKIREGKDAESILENNEIRIAQLMGCYLGIRGE